jgi:hypothetical protein
MPQARDRFKEFRYARFALPGREEMRQIRPVFAGASRTGFGGMPASRPESTY